MRPNIFILFIATAFTLLSCEQTIDVDLPYERLIVVNTFVGRTMDSLAWISRTLPATEEATFENAAIMDANVKMYWRDTVYQLSPMTSKRGFVLPPPDTRWQGDSMRMVVEWGGLRAESNARMPIAPTLTKVSVVPKKGDPDYRTIVVTLRTRPGCVIWLQRGFISRERAEPPMDTYNYYRVVPGDPEGPEQEVTIDTGDNYYLGPGGSIEVMVCTADAVYAKFLDEPRRNSDDPFSFGGASTFTNVGGRGIGMFVPVVSVIETVVVE